eukprot:g27098.t1
MRRNFYSQRVVDLYNSLLQKAVEAKSLKVFKTEIDSFLIGKTIKRYREKLADKGDAIVVWRTDLYLAEAERQHSDTSSYLPLDHDPTMTHQAIV